MSAAAALIKAHQERQLLEPYTDVMKEAQQLSLEQLNQFMLYSAAKDPLCVEDYLLLIPEHDEPIEGMLRFMRDQLHPVVDTQLFENLSRYIQLRDHVLHHAFVFWTFVALMLADESLLRVVRDTWPGSDRMWTTVLLPYISNRLDDILLSPMDPENADLCIELMRNVVAHELGPFNVPAMLLEGILRPVAVPLSRNALRDRKRDAIAQRAADAQARQAARHQQQQQQHPPQSPGVVDAIFRIKLE